MQVGVHADVQLLRQLLDAQECSFVDGVRRVRGDGEGEAVAPSGVAFDELHSLRGIMTSQPYPFVRECM